MRTVVVGASTGLGRSTAIGLASRGAQVALLARREELIRSAAEEIGDGAVPIVCDVTDEAGCKAAIGQAAEALGGIDSVVYTTGMGPLGKIETLDADTWNRTFATNVTGASIVTAAALPHLQASKGTIVYFSSVSASLTAPWQGLAAYTVTKAALDKLVEAWRGEHGEVAFTRITVGECGGGDGEASSQFTAGWDMSLAAELFPVWMQRGYMGMSLMEIEEFIDVIDNVLRAGRSTHIPSITIIPRRPA